MASPGVSVGAVALAGAAAVTVYAGWKGVALGSGLRAILGGHTLPTGDPLAIDTAGSASVAGGVSGAVAAVGSAVGVELAQAAQKYVGSGSVYAWGKGSPAGWDCSGFINYVLCHDLRLAIPGYAGGTFTGSAHGPVTAQWALWSGCTTIPRSQVQAGDLVVWPAQHMGMAIDNTTMVNAPGPNGTPAPVTGGIDHTGLGPFLCRRLNGAR